MVSSGGLLFLYVILLLLLLGGIDLGFERTVHRNAMVWLVFPAACFQKAISKTFP